MAFAVHIVPHVGGWLHPCPTLTPRTLSLCTGGCSSSSGHQPFPPQPAPSKATSFPQVMQMPPHLLSWPGLEEKCTQLQCGSSTGAGVSAWGSSTGISQVLAGVQHLCPVFPWGFPIPFQSSAGCSALAITCPLIPHFSSSRAPLVPSLPL